MGRWCYGLVFAAALVAGCASAAAPVELQQQTGDNSDLSGVDLAGGVVVDNCTPGVACTTQNPGVCAMGHAFCTGNVLSCVPDATTQSCYDGPAGTEGKGACKAGVQTCIGALGSCDGEVKPAALENCFNDLDDDCDGVVNNGCPDHVAVGTAHALTLHGNAGGGNAAPLRCPANAYLTKVVVYADDSDGAVAGLDITCATPTLVRGASSYSVTQTAVAANPSTQRAANITTGDNFTYDCGAGFTPGSWSYGESVDGSGGAVVRLGFHCSTGALALGSDNKLSITLTKQGSATGFGYSYSDSAAFEDDCPAGEVLVGYDLRSGNWFDAAQTVCAPLQVVYK